MKYLFIISNESIFNYQGKFFCDNIDMKSTPEGLNNKFEVNIIARKSNKIRSHKINLKNVKIYGNIISFLFAVFRSIKNENSKYAFKAKKQFSWTSSIPEKIFLDNVLPYASLNERRDTWRKEFFNKFSPLVKNAKSGYEAAAILNNNIFKNTTICFFTMYCQTSPVTIIRIY